ncbi:MAG: hypothetical protein R2762_11115 [Bryobacteraceae bacterium]
MAWKEQPAESIPVVARGLARRRLRALRSRTRGDIVAGLAGSLLFAAVIGWRFAETGEVLPWAGCVLIVLWVLISAYRFRDQIIRLSRFEGLTVTGLEFYRSELERRRGHLRSAWIWYGPLLLACLTLLATLASRAPDPRILSRSLPFVILLAVWVVYGYWLRRREANELQAEIDEIDRERSMS